MFEPSAPLTDGFAQEWAKGAVSEAGGTRVAKQLHAKQPHAKQPHAKPRPFLGSAYRNGVVWEALES